jgi:23S rRNA (uracil1939-C5)-methyltransferase
VEEFLEGMEETPDFVLADPPRAGLGPAVVSQLKRLAPPELTVVSCDPATLARDIAAMPEYKIVSLTLVDLFPQTFHLETVVHLVRA